MQPEDLNTWAEWPPIVLVRESATRLVRVLEQIEPVMQRDDIAPWVLVGGLAVQIWVQSDRATKDIDLSVQDRSVTASIVRQHLATATAQRNGVTIDGVAVDFLEAFDPSLIPDDVAIDDAWFRNLTWFEALRLRYLRRLIAMEQQEARTVEVAVALPGILLAMKLAAVAAAAPGASDKRLLEKQGSDVYDIVTLVEAATAERLIIDLRRADQRLFDRTVELADRWLLGEPMTLAKRTELSADSGVIAVVSGRVEQCGFDLSEAVASMR